MWDDIKARKPNGLVALWTNKVHINEFQIALLADLELEDNGERSAPWVFPADLPSEELEPKSSKSGEDKEEEGGRNLTSKAEVEVFQPHPDMPTSHKGWITIKGEPVPSANQVPKIARSPSRVHTDKCFVFGNIDEKGFALATPPHKGETSLTPEEICEIAEKGDQQEMSKRSGVFYTSTEFAYTIKPAFTWVLFRLGKVGGELRFPLSRDRLEKVFPGYAMAFHRYYDGPSLPTKPTSGQKKDTRDKHEGRATAADVAALHAKLDNVFQQNEEIKEMIESHFSNLMITLHKMKHKSNRKSIDSNLEDRGTGDGSWKASRNPFDPNSDHDGLQKQGLQFETEVAPVTPQGRRLQTDSSSSWKETALPPFFTPTVIEKSPQSPGKSAQETPSKAPPKATPLEAPLEGSQKPSPRSRLTPSPRHSKSN